jgi:signal transduction histidine kinase
LGGLAAVGFWISRVLLGVVLTAGLIFEDASDGRLTLIISISLLLFVLSAIRLPGKLEKPADFLEILLAVSLEAVSQYAVNPFFALVYVVLIFERAYGARIPVRQLTLGVGRGVNGFLWRAEENKQTLSGWWIAALVVGAAVKYGEILRRDPAYFDLGAAVQFLGLLTSVAVALRFAQGYRRERDELARLSREIEALSAVKEQKRISRELHDALGHALTTQIMRLEMADHFLEAGRSGDAAEQVTSAKAEGRSMLRSVQEIVTTLRDPVWVRSDFEALAERGGTVALPNGKQMVKLDIVGDLSLLSPRANHVLYRALQESLTNARRHSNAEHVVAALTVEEGGGAKLLVENDGPLVQSPVFPGNGLRGMQERVLSLGGTLNFGPVPGGGFRIEVSLPPQPQ